MSVQPLPVEGEPQTTAAAAPTEVASTATDRSRPVFDQACPEPVTSQDLGELFQALSDIQAKVENPTATGTNEDLGTRHLTLAGVLIAARPLLREHGLCIVQMPSGGFLRTILGHKSGQFIQCDTPLLLERSDLTPMQALASAVSFARRIAMTSILGMAQPDDDGQGTGAQGMAPRPALSLAGGAGTAASAAAGQPRRGFSVTATIEAIKAKTLVSELDDAKVRVESAFKGDDLKQALDAIEERRRVLTAKTS